MDYITSVKNEKIKEIKKLSTVKGRRHQHLYLIEGEHLVNEALKSQVNIKELLVTENFINHDEHHIIKQLYNQTTQISDNVAQVIPAFQKQKLPVYGTLVDDQALNYRQLTAPEEFALIMGNEAHGMQAELIPLVDKNLYIPLVGQAESLNVAIAAGILMFSL